MAARKPFLLRLDPAVHEALQRWADAELRSLNGQIEFLLRDALQKTGKLGASQEPAAHDALLARYDCDQVHTTFGGFDEDLKPLDLDPDRLLRDLVRGWQYLIDNDPRILAWIVRFQIEHFGVPDYPVEGTP